MLNRLTNVKLFCMSNEKYRYAEKIQAYNLDEFKIPDEFMRGKINNFRNYQYPLVSEIMNAYKSGYITLVDMNDPYVMNEKNKNYRSNTNWPSYLFTLPNSVKKTVYIDLSTRGKYMTNAATKEKNFYTIEQLDLFAMCTVGYIHGKLLDNEKATQNATMLTKVSDCYAKIMGNVLSIMCSTNDMVDRDKMHALSMIFCLQTMFGCDKETAVKYAKKSKFITDKVNALSTSLYCTDPNADFIENSDFVKKFPIDVFADTIIDEFKYITNKVCNTGKIVQQFSEWFNRSSAFAVEYSMSFISLLVLGKYGIDMFNNFRLKKFLGSLLPDVVKDISSAISNK